MGYHLKINLPGLPPLQNKLNTMHWTQRTSSNKKWFKWVMLSISLKKPIKPLSKAKVTFTRGSAATPDSDGLQGSFKAIRDALVKLGILEDDSPKHLDAHYVWIPAPRSKGYVSIEVEEVE